MTTTPALTYPATRLVAWMDVPEWCKPPENAYTGLFIQRLSRTKLFKEKYQQNGFLDRLERVVFRTFAMIGLFCYALGSLCFFKDIKASFALLFLSFGMIPGYLPRILNPRVQPILDSSSIDDKNLPPEGSIERSIAIARLLVSNAATQICIDEEMLKAAEVGDPHVIKVLIVEGKANPNAKGNAALLIAASHSHDLAVRELLQQGADPENAKVDGLDPIMALILGVQHYSSLFRLLEEKHRENYSNQINHEETARELVRGGVPFNQEAIEELSRGLELLKERDKNNLKHWWYEEVVRRFDAKRYCASSGIVSPKLIKQWKEEQAHCKPNDYFNYMYTILHFSSGKFRYIDKPIIIPKDDSCSCAYDGVTYETNAWVRAFNDEDETDKFVQRFTRIKNALVDAKKEAIWRRTEEIIKAIPCFPTAGVPPLISEYCYS